MKKTAITMGLTLLLILLTVSFVSAEGQRDERGYSGGQGGFGMMGNPDDDSNYWGNGMMGGNNMMGGSGSYGMMSGNNMMGGPGSYGMMGGYGNFSNNTPFSPTGERLTIEEAEENVLDYLEQRRMKGLELNEIMEFQSNYYVQIKESDTGINAFELLVDPYYGYITMEPGPNMMWNSKYGNMSGWESGEMVVSEEDAIAEAVKYLDTYSSGLSADEHADIFYGYYTLHTLKDGKIDGMLSINGYSGDVWYHSWHGVFLKTEEGTDNHS